MLYVDEGEIFLGSLVISTGKTPGLAFNLKNQLFAN